MCSGPGQGESIEITLEPHAGMRGRCSQCQRPAPGYDRLPERRWLFVPLVGNPNLLSLRHGEWSAPSTGWWSSTFRGVTASVR